MKLFKKLLIIFFSFIVLSIIVFFSMWVIFARQLDISKIVDIRQTITIYDKFDDVAANIYAKENREKINIEELPDYVKYAFIAIEDERFYSHKGIDVKRIGGATLKNIKSGAKSEGASTITQQLIKLSHLSSEKTYSRKIKEAFLALELERRYSKDEILEMYLNYCYFGNGAYGIETSANKYFGINANELTISQSAMLAGILKSPTNYSPHLNYENSMKRRNLVLSQMKKVGAITEEQYNEALNEKIEIIESDNKPYPYGYYIDTVLYEAEKILNTDQETLLKEGYFIYTTLDLEVQNTLEEVAKTDIPKNQSGTMPEIAMVSLNNKGQITGLVGGREHTARRGINRAMDITRSPGSAIKPILVYAPAIEEKNYTAASFILDEKQNFGDYSPSNATNKFSGWVTMRYAIANSLNIPAVKVFQDIGIETGKEYAKSVGIKFESEDNHLALALGGFTKGVTPMSLTGAYLPFTNGGYYNEPYSIRKITDKTGKVVYEKFDDPQKVLSEDTAFLMTDMLKDTVEYGTAKKISGLNIAGKTGTSSTTTGGTKDAWFVSYTSDSILSVWIGNDDGSSLPSGISGSSYPVLIAGEFYNKVPGFSTDFVKPDNIVEVNLDKVSLDKEHKVMLANEFTPNEYILKEYFTKQTSPKEFSNSYNSINEIQNFSVEFDEYPKIKFDSGYDSINYKIFRKQKNEVVEIYNTQGKNEQIEYIDKEIKKGEKYEYYVVATIGKKRIETQKIAVNT